LATEAQRPNTVGALSDFVSPPPSLEVVRPAPGMLPEKEAGELWHVPDSRWARLGLITVDFLLLTINSLAAFYIKFLYRRPYHPGMYRIHGIWFSREHLALMLLFGTFTILFCHNYGLYRLQPNRTKLDEILAVWKSLILAGLLFAIFISLGGSSTFPLVVLSMAAALDFASLAGWRLVRRQMFELRVAQGQAVRNVLIVGVSEAGRKLADYFERNRGLGFVVRGFLDSSPADDVHVVGRIEDLPQVARAHFVDEVFITQPLDREIVREVALLARRSRLDVRIVPDLFTDLTRRAPLSYMGDVPVLAVHREPIPAIALFFKRIMDVAGSGLLLLVASPLMALISLAVKLDSEGPALYRSVRIGKKGRRFAFYKFRTMVNNADELRARLRAMNEREGPFFKIANDPRITRVGKLLRKYSLDELPQLWNVLKGDMSLVGPRPPIEDEVDQYSLEHLRRLDVTPGITGLWQIKARRDPSFERNIALDLEYIENWSPTMDVKILLRTIPAVLKGVGE
jgi:exopolysaccharide biosynthesis polyprenyl glycosylphosphotransferase